MHLIPASFHPTNKGKFTSFCKGPIKYIENSHALVEQSFHNVLPGDEASTITPYGPESSSSDKGIKTPARCY